MTKVTLIVGLPASGKTTLAEHLAKENQGIVIDDPQHFALILKAMESNPQVPLFIADPMLCFATARESARKKLEELGCEVEWIFFENNPDQCQINATTRSNKPVKKDIHYLSQKYQIPDNIKPIPVYKPE